MRIDVDRCRDPDLLAAEVRLLQAVIAAAPLTLTDEEREAVADGIRCCEYMASYKPMKSRANLVASAATLRGLLERTTNFPDRDNSAK